MIEIEAVKSGFIHGAYAVAFQLIVALATGSWALGAMGAIMFYLGREHAQREYKIAGYTKKSLSIKDLKPWQAFDMTQWTQDEVMDLLVPTLLVLIVLTISILV